MFITIDGVPFGALKSFQIIQDDNRGVKLSLSAQGDNYLILNENIPHRIRIQTDKQILIFSQVWISNWKYDFQSRYSVGDLVIEAIAESIEHHDIKYIVKICNYCNSLSDTIFYYHNRIIASIEHDPHKDNILKLLGFLPLDKTKQVPQTIEILKKHFPEVYDNIEKLIVLA